MAPPVKRCFTIALLGTSLTNGRLATGWDVDLRNALKAAVDRDVQVVNFGKGSQTTVSWGVPMAPVVAALKPDLILSEGFAINDCAMGIDRPTHLANVNSMIATWKAASPRSRICIQTMSPASAGDSFRTHLGDYYTDEISAAVANGVDFLSHYVDWPNPLPTSLTQIDPSTGLPDGLHPTKAANRQYFFPSTLAYVTPLVLSAPSGL
jgi:hypothetical protein